MGVEKHRQREVGVKQEEKKRLIDRDTMTVGRYTGQTKAGISNYNLQNQKDMCVCLHSEPLSPLSFFETITSDKIHLERSTDRCQFQKVYDFRHVAEILRMGQSESPFFCRVCHVNVVFKVSWGFFRECDCATEHALLRHHFS